MKRFLLAVAITFVLSVSVLAGETSTPPGETQTPPGEVNAPPGETSTPPGMLATILLTIITWP